MKNILNAMIVALFLAGCSAGCASRSKTQPADALGNDTVKSLDLNRYAGLWYEIATIPQGFEKDCVGTTATYRVLPDGNLEVYNQCHLKTLGGEQKDIKGKAKVPDPTEPGRLKVDFGMFKSGDYWVLELGETYNYAVVGTPDKKQCWILARQTTMDPVFFQAIVERLRRRGYEVEKIRKTVHAA
jgi:apolipoprotein D and lipocalin family protein